MKTRHAHVSKLQTPLPHHNATVSKNKKKGGRGKEMKKHPKHTHTHAGLVLLSIKK